MPLSSKVSLLSPLERRLGEVGAELETLIAGDDGRELTRILDRHRLHRLMDIA
jgi:hypothetical protein